MKGGASLHDPYGLTHTKVQAYLARHPEASFDEVERKCFKGKDMKHEFTAISPRLFESSMAGTCQILQRDDYLGVLEPWRDYIPLERNYSNVNEVVSTMRDLDKCQEIVTNARIALVDSQMFDYSQLVDSACQGVLPEQSNECTTWKTFTEYLCFSQSAQQIAPELHDAALHMMREVNFGTGYSVESQVVWQQLKKHELLEWFIELQRLDNQTNHKRVVPWVWRTQNIVFIEEMLT